MSAGRRNVKDMSKVFALLGIIALLSALLTVLCACKDNVPEKYVKRWDPHSDYSDSDYRVVQTDGEIIEAAYLFAVESLKVYFKYMIKYKLDYNLPSDFEEIRNNYPDAYTVMLITAEIIENCNKDEDEN